jgi:hypothetical protein
VRVHRDGEEVARLLFDRFASAVGVEERQALLVIQWSPQMLEASVDGLVERAREHGVTVLDLRAVLEPVVATRGIGAAFELHVDPDRPSGVGHMSPRGNGIAAAAIAEALRAARPGV